MLDILLYNNINLKSSVLTFTFKFEYGSFKTGLIELNIPSINLYYPDFSGACLTNGRIEKLSTIIPDFQYDRFISSMNSFVHILDLKKVSEFSGYKFNFIPKSFTFEGFVLDNIMILYTSTFIQITFFCITIYLMQRISTLVCSYNMDFSSFLFSNYLCKGLENNRQRGWREGEGCRL